MNELMRGRESGDRKMRGWKISGGGKYQGVENVRGRKISGEGKYQGDKREKFK